MTEMNQISLSLREEGIYWNAYVTLPGSDKKKLIGSIVLGACQNDPVVRQSFFELMQRVVTNAIQHVSGEPAPAPIISHEEKSGHA